MTSEELKEKMERYGYNDRTLGEELGCTPQAVWALRHGKARITVHVKKFFERREEDAHLEDIAYHQIHQCLRQVSKASRPRVIAKVRASLEGDKS